MLFSFNYLKTLHNVMNLNLRVVFFKKTLEEAKPLRRTVFKSFIKPNNNVQ